jgi:hypothetical protein
MVDQERQAERWSYQPPRQEKRDRLINMAVTNIAIAHGTLPASARIEPAGQLEEYIDRISIGGGAPVELFKLQGDPRGAGFISQLPPRKHEAQHRYGFQFGHRQDEEKSWHWLILDDSGTRPRMTPVACAPEKDGTPRSRPAPAVAPKVEQTPKPPAQESLFDLGAPTGARPPGSAADFVERERGVR